MGMNLPEPLVWVLNLIGVNWPDIDEDELRSAASDLRQFAQELSSDTDDAKSQIEQMLQNNSSESLELFEALWNKLSGTHLPQVTSGMNVVAEALDIGAVVVVGMKVAAIAQLVILAAEIISDQIEAAFTFGATEALIPIQTLATREIMKTIEDKVIQQIEQQVLGMVEQPVIDALTSAAENLGEQLLGNALGVNHGIDLGQVASAGESGFSQGVQSDIQNPLGLPLGGGSGNGQSSDQSSDSSTDQSSDGSSSDQSSNGSSADNSSVDQSSDAAVTV